MKMFKVLIFIFISVLNSSIYASTSIRVNVDKDDWQPYLFHSGSEAKGIFVDTVKNVAKSNSIKVNFTSYRRNAADKMIRRGLIDATFSAKDWEKKSQNYIWTTPILKSCTHVVSKKNKKIELSELMNGKYSKVGLLRGSINPKIKSFVKKYNLNVKIYKSLADLSDDIYKKKVDAALMNRFSVKWYEKTNAKIKNVFHYSSNTVSCSDMSLKFYKSPTNNSIAKIFNLEINNLRKSGALRNIISNYIF